MMSGFKLRYLGMVFCLLIISIISSNASAQEPDYQVFLPLISLPTPPDPFDKYSPADGATDQDLVLGLWWVPSEWATNYEYCIDTTNDNACSSWISTGINNYAVPPQLTPGTTYYWQVRAWNGMVGPTYANGDPHSFWSFATLDLNPAPFVKYSPVDGATDQDLLLGLWWVPSERATRYEYCMDTTNDNSCTEWISTGPNNNVVPPELTSYTTYYWQVRAWNGTYGPTYANGSPTSFWSLRTKDVFPSPFTKYSPQDGAINQGVVVSLWWVPAERVTNYEYCIDTSNDNACSNWVSTGTNNYAVPPQLTPYTTYFWQVRAWNGTYGPMYADFGATDFWEFTTNIPNPIQNGDFESGDVVWLEISTEGFDLILNTSQDLPISPHNGSWLAWLGGYPNENSLISQVVTIPAGRSILHFWIFTASADYCGYDVFGVLVNDDIVYDQWVCDDNDTNGWVQRTVDLAAYAGQTIELKFLAGVDGSLNSNIWLDDISLEATFSLLGSMNEDSISDGYKTDQILLDVMKDTQNQEIFLSNPGYGDEHQLSEMLIRKLRGLKDQLLID